MNAEHTLPKVLIVEDSALLQMLYADELAGQAQILPAYTVDEGRKCFAAHPDVRIVVMDACLEGNSPDTIELTKEFRKADLTRPMIAASSLGPYAQMLMEAGCTHDAGGKKGVPEIVLSLLKNCMAPL